MFRDCVSIPIFSHAFYFLLTPSRLPSVSLCLCVLKSVRGCAEGKHRGTEVTDWVVYRLRLDTNLFPSDLFPVHPIPSSICVSVPLCFKIRPGTARKGNTEAQRSQIGLFIDCVSIRIFSHPFYFLLTPSRLPSVSLCLCVSNPSGDCAEGKHRGTEVTKLGYLETASRYQSSPTRSISCAPHPFFPLCLYCLCVSKSVWGYLNGALLRHSTPLHASDS